MAEKWTKYKSANQRSMKA